MVKLAFAFSILFVSLINPNTQASILSQQKWYTGINSGASNIKDTFKQYHNFYQNNYYEIIRNLLKLNYSFFLGYKINPYLSVEVLSRLAGKMPQTVKFQMPKIFFSDIEYTTKLVLPVTKKLSLYTKIGRLLSQKFQENKLKGVNLKNYIHQDFFPFFASGIQFFLNNKIYVDFSYQVKKSILDLGNLNIRSILDNLNLSISWQFGENEKNTTLFDICTDNKYSYL
ncbi:outer membrane beta-barrel protein [Buchnera aphidicola]|uniref:outer membrane beta-barrel protein n=1 Tax=Buchnera aphidicola TaxID=9 RepID=UPI00094C15AC|nr:outer membrane beta-barrel protein [Buchnera aphidicola]